MVELFRQHWLAIGLIALTTVLLALWALQRKRSFEVRRSETSISFDRPPPEDKG